MFLGLGFHQFFNKRSNTYKDKDVGCGMDILPNTMESDSVTTLVQDSTAIFVDDRLWRTPQRRSNRHASQVATANIKSMYEVDEGGCKSRVPQAPKRQAVGSPEAGDLNTHDPDYAPILLSESEADDEMRDPWDDIQPSPRSSPISITYDDCDKEQDPSLGHAPPTWRGSPWAPIVMHVLALRPRRRSTSEEDCETCKTYQKGACS